MPTFRFRNQDVETSGRCEPTIEKAAHDSLSDSLRATRGHLWREIRAAAEAAGGLQLRPHSCSGIRNGDGVALISIL